jgi:hypothetical protein
LAFFFMAHVDVRILLPNGTSARGTASKHLYMLLEPFVFFVN